MGYLDISIYSVNVIVGDVKVVARGDLPYNT